MKKDNATMRIVTYAKGLNTKKKLMLMLKETLGVKMMKRLRPLVDSVSMFRSDGYQIHLHIPAFINVRIDDRFEIVENELTFTFHNKKLALTIFKDETVTANITIYDTKI